MGLYVRFWRIASFRSDTEFGSHRGIADNGPHQSSLIYEYAAWLAAFRDAIFGLHMKLTVRPRRE
jgi:hypothetical protein